MPLSFEIHSLMVREIWIGYFPAYFNQEMIRQVLQKYVQVDHIDLKKKMQNFAFVRLTTAQDA